MTSSLPIQSEREEQSLEISSLRKGQCKRCRISSEHLECDRSGELGLRLGKQYLGDQDVEWVNSRLTPEKASSVCIHPGEQPTAHCADCLVRHAIVRRCVSSLSSDPRSHGDLASLAEPRQRRVGRIHICWARVQAQPAKPRPCSTSPTTSDLWLYITFDQHRPRAATSSRKRRRRPLSTAAFWCLRTLDQLERAHIERLRDLTDPPERRRRCAVQNLPEVGSCDSRAVRQVRQRDLLLLREFTNPGDESAV